MTLPFDDARIGQPQFITDSNGTGAQQSDNSFSHWIHFGLVATWFKGESSRFFSWIFVGSQIFLCYCFLIHLKKQNQQQIIKIELSPCYTDYHYMDCPVVLMSSRSCLRTAQSLGRGGRWRWCRCATGGNPRNHRSPLPIKRKQISTWICN